MYCVCIDSRDQWYKEIERRIARLEGEEQKKSEKRDKRKGKWIDRSIGFGIGILVSILSGLAIAYLK